MKKFVIILLAIVLAVSMLSACASNETTAEGAMQDSGVVKEDYSGAAPAEAAPMPSEAVAQDTTADQWGLTNLENNNVTLADTDRKLVYTSDFTIDTSEYDADYQKIKDLLSTSQGYIESESTSGQKPTTENTAGRSSSFVLRVPVANYDNFLNGIVAIGKLQSKNIYASDISSNYYDNEARIAVLEEREAKLNEYLKNATNIEDQITIEQELSDVLYQLDELKGTQRGMDKQVEYATVSVYLYETAEAANLGTSDASVSERASNAFSMSMIGVGKFFNEFAVFIAGAFPVIVLLLAIFAAVFAVMYGIRKLNKKIKSKQKK